MSGHLPVVAADGALTSAGVVRAGTVPTHGAHVPTAPHLPRLRDHPLNEVSPERVDEFKDEAADGESDTEVDEDTGEDDDVEALERKTAAFIREEAAILARRRQEEEAATQGQRRLDALRRFNLHKTRVRHLRDEDVRAKSALEEEARHADAVAAAAAERTPARVHTRPRMLSFQTTAGKKAQSDEARAKQASIDALPDRAPAGGTVVYAQGGSVYAPATAVTAPPLPYVPAAAASSKDPRPLLNKPKEFSGDDSVQNERVERWVEAMNRYLFLSHTPAALHLETARSFLSSDGSAGEWVAMQEELVQLDDKELTWEWLQAELIEHFGKPSGTAAMEAEWQSLRMGLKNPDGTDTGKATRSVKTYTNRFLQLMRRLTEHSAKTRDITIVQKYVRGIEDGYPALYAVMKGVEPILRFATLQDAIDAAEVAEAKVKISQMTPSRATHGAQQSGWGGAHRPRQDGGRAQPSESLNSLEGETSDGDEGREGETARPRAQLNGFRFITLPSNDGRHVLTEAQQRMLYEQKRCYRCYGQHPVGTGKPACTKPVQKEAPRPLK